MIWNYRRFPVLINIKFEYEFHQISQLSPSWLHFWQLIFVTKFGDILPSISTLGKSFMLPLYTHVYTCRYFINTNVFFLLNMQSVYNMIMLVLNVSEFQQ